MWRKIVLQLAKYSRNVEVCPVFSAFFRAFNFHFGFEFMSVFNFCFFCFMFFSIVIIFSCVRSVADALEKDLVTLGFQVRKSAAKSAMSMQPYCSLMHSNLVYFHVEPSGRYE